MDVVIVAEKIEQGSTCITTIDGVSGRATVESVELHRDAIEEAPVDGARRFKPGPQKLSLTLVLVVPRTFTQEFFQSTDNSLHVPNYGDKHPTKPGYVVTSVVVGLSSVMHSHNVTYTEARSDGGGTDDST